MIKRCNLKPGWLAVTLACTALAFGCVFAGDLAQVRSGENVQWVGNFEGSGTPPSPWQIVRFNSRVPPTQYTVRRWQGVPAVEAVAHASMALLARPLAINLARTPMLCWRWRIDAPVATADLTKREGDDFAARVYVAFRMPRESMSALTRLKLRVGRAIYGQFTPDA